MLRADSAASSQPAEPHDRRRSSAVEARGLPCEPAGRSCRIPSQQPGLVLGPHSGRASKKASIDIRLHKDTPDTCPHSQKVKDFRLELPPKELESLKCDIFADSRKQSRDPHHDRPQPQARRLNFSALDRSGDPADSPSSFQLDLDEFDFEVRRAPQEWSSDYHRVVDQIEAMIQKVGQQG